MDELIKDYKNYACFTFYENDQSCMITIYNDEKVLCQKIVSEAEGRKNLIAFCLFWRYLEPVPHIDTVALINSDKARGFVRYMESYNVIKDLKHDLLPSFICTFLETIQEQYEKMEIDYRYNRYDNFEMSIFANNKEEKDKKFYFTFLVDIKRYFPYIISEYMKRHEYLNVQEIKEDSSQIILDGIEFPMKLLNNKQREFFRAKIRENSDSFKQFLKSNLGKDLHKVLEEQDNIQLIRIKSE